MQLLKRLFISQEPVATPLPTPVPQDTTVLDKLQVKDLVEQSLNESYRTEDPVGLVAEELRQVSSAAEIDERLSLLEKCLSAVNHGLYLDVMDHYDKFVSGMENIHLIEQDLRDSKEMARRGRLRLKELSSVFLDRSLEIVRRNTRKEKLERLWKELQDFGDVCLRTSLRINQATEDGELYHSLMLCAEASATLSSVDVSKFTVYKTILDDIEMKRGKVYMKMKESLTQLCSKFDARLYENVLLAYTSSTSFDEVKSAIHEEFMVSISRLLIKTVEEYADKNASGVGLESLVKCVPNDSFVDCLRLVAKRLSAVLFSRWHEANDQQDLDSSGFSVTKQYITDAERLGNVLKFYSTVKADLLRSKKHLWTELQSKFAVFLEMGNQLDSVASPDICKALGLVNTLIEIGEDFSGESSIKLKEAAKLRCEKWFGFFRQMSWNKLASLLEAEQWTRLPIPKDFDIRKLTETELNTGGPVLKALSLQNEEYTFSFSSLAFHDPFSDTQDRPNPIEPKDSFSGISLSDSAPVLCTSALKFIKTVTLYLSLTKSFTPISFVILTEISNLIEFFLYTVYSLFTSEGARHMLFAELSEPHSLEQLETQYDTYLFQSKFTNLRKAVVRIKDYLDSVQTDKSPSLSPYKRQLNSSNANLFLLAERLIALDSCRHLWSVVAQSQEFISEVVPQDEMHFVTHFLTQTKDTIDEMDLFLSETQLPKLVRLEMIVGQINSIRWNEASEESNNYVDRLVHILDDLKERLRTIGGGSLPKPLQWKVLRSAFAFTCEQLIDCYSKVKRCSTAGRRQMEVDLVAFREVFSEVKDLPSLDGHLEYLRVWTEDPDVIKEFMLRRTDLPLRLHRQLLASAPQCVPISTARRNQILAEVEEKCKATLKAA